MPPRRVIALLLCASIFGLACEASSREVKIASAADAAETFVQAWADGEGSDMHAMLGEEASAMWTPSKLDRFLGRTLRSGRIEAFDVNLASDVTEPRAEFVVESEEPVELPIDYALTYESGAVDDEVILDGTFELSYDEEADEWYAGFDKSLMWPGIEDAARFAIKSDWPKRGRIVDRRGRVLARGQDAERRYPFGSLAGNTIGHLEPLSKKSLKEATPGHEPGDLVGGSGLELAYEERLAGEPDVSLIVTDKRGKQIAILEQVFGESSRDVKSTIDIEVQRAAAAGFGGTVGGAVVLQPRSGDILAAVSAFEIDPNNYVGVPDVEPFNRALSGLYPPGSAMKVVTAGAALDTKTVTPNTQLTGPAEYQGVRNFESGSYPSLSFASAVQNSVNTAFAQVALDLGARKLLRYAEGFGFNQDPVMPLGAATPSFPFPEDAGDLMWGSIGQAQDLATPLQMASVAATVANYGKRMEPRSALGDPKEGERVLEKATARTLAGLMESVVQGGTGVNAQISGVRVAGKTGTAEVDVNGKRMNHAWFISFAPAGDPEIAVAVVSEYGGVGGQVAAPIARSILAGALPLTR
ncbi:MAG: penicillin-binding transpeptidase domain-containing protein [Actinomycetota bacterium]